MAVAETEDAEDLVGDATRALSVARTEVRPDPRASLILAIETSCDETSVAVLRGGREVLANVVASSAQLHERFGGVVPEIASREQLRALNPAIEEALRSAEATLWDLSVIGVTLGPGLIGSLLVGVEGAKSLASVLDLPLVGVNHLESHLYANFVADPAAVPPAMGLVVSGGHTLLVHMLDHGRLEIVGQTLDDAAGEAFDKVGRYAGLGFPGGPAIDEKARGGDPRAISFPRALAGEGYDFSFSGLKTAVLRYLDAHEGEVDLADFCASFQEAVADVLSAKTVRAAAEAGVDRVLLSGGVAANSRLRELMAERCAEAGLGLFCPPTELCTDNAAMVAACAYQRFRLGTRTPLDVRPDPNLPLSP